MRSHIQVRQGDFCGSLLDSSTAYLAQAFQTYGRPPDGRAVVQPELDLRSHRELVAGARGLLQRGRPEPDGGVEQAAQRVAVRPRYSARAVAAALGGGHLQPPEVRQPHRQRHGEPRAATTTAPGRRRGSDYKTCTDRQQELCRVGSATTSTTSPLPSIRGLPGGGGYVLHGMIDEKQQGALPANGGNVTVDPRRSSNTPGTAWTRTSSSARAAGCAFRAAPARVGGPQHLLHRHRHAGGEGPRRQRVRWRRRAKGRPGRRLPAARAVPDERPRECQLHDSVDRRAGQRGLPVPAGDGAASANLTSFEHRRGMGTRQRGRATGGAPDPVTGEPTPTLFFTTVGNPTSTTVVNLLGFRGPLRRRPANLGPEVREERPVREQAAQHRVGRLQPVQQRCGDWLRERLHRVPSAGRHLGGGQSGHTRCRSAGLGKGQQNVLTPRHMKLSVTFDF